MKILFINVEILAFISRINTVSESLKARKLYFQHISFYEQLKFHKFYYPGPRAILGILSGDYLESP